MSPSLVQSRALLGLEAASVTVEVHLANGLPSFTLVGLVDVEVREARERVRSAIQNAGLEFPNNKRITVNLAPADLPKDSGRFDLPIALGILAASGQIDAARLAGHEFAGELSLSGQLRPVRGALAMALALHTRGIATRLVLPAASAQEAALVPGAEVYGAQHLLDVVRQFLPAGSESPPEPSADGWARVLPAPRADGVRHADLAEVKGHAGAKRALEIAAVDGHSLLMVGPPGSGKSMLAQRFAGLLPAMSVDEALESAAVASLGGRFAIERWMHRPTSSPHHTASAVAMVGGGSPPRPGERPCASRWRPAPSRSPAPRGAPSSRRLPAHRRDESVPLRLSGLGAEGLPLYTGPGDALPGQAQRPAARPHRPAHRGAGDFGAATAGGTGRRSHRCDPRTCGARPRPRAGTAGRTNHALQGAEIDRHAALAPDAMKFMHTAAARLGWSARSTHRALKVARTIADLAGTQAVEAAHVAEAVRYRRALRGVD